MSMEWHRLGVESYTDSKGPFRLPKLLDNANSRRTGRHFSSRSSEITSVLIFVAAQRNGSIAPTGNTDCPLAIVTLSHRLLKQIGLTVRSV